MKGKRKYTSILNGIETRQRINAIQKELFRKAIHMCAALVPLFLSLWYVPTMILLLLSLIVYSVAESLRYRDVEVPFISAITSVAARKRDENKFVLGPVTLVLGILFTAALFPPIPATVGILSLAFGDGLASLIGKLWGHIKIPFTRGKTVAGSFSCFGAIFIATFCVTKNFEVALGCAIAGMIIELIPLKDFDNLLIPVAIASLCEFYFQV